MLLLGDYQEAERISRTMSNIEGQNKLILYKIIVA